MTDPPALKVIGVTVRFGGNVAVDDVSLAAQAGAITGLIGPNGAGKTTLFNVISGLQPPTSGAVHLEGADVTRLPTHKRARRGMARTFQRLELFGILTAHGNVKLAVDVRARADRDIRAGVNADAEAYALLERVGLLDLAHMRADSLSTGKARLVELARALAIRPKVLLLDEPASGLTEEETVQFGAILRELAGEGMAVVLVEHDVSLVFAVCDVVHVLDRGALLASGDPSSIRADQRVLDAYLGDAGVPG
ncbi:MAG: ABC transporter ATP-binding protein [Acidimicrobiia bacterium]|nr:ABC transporter ATP-binding protein [Acidimicrobiia bacterium]